jgi:hypothetical protein
LRIGPGDRQALHFAGRVPFSLRLEADSTVQRYWSATSHGRSHPTPLDLHPTHAVADSSEKPGAAWKERTPRRPQE